MTSFAQAFWSSDYAGGLGVLFAKLQQGVQENQQVLTIARMRADAEDLYGQHMGDIGPACDRYSDGFSRDDGASVRKAYDGMRTEMDAAAMKHRKIADNIRELVIYPFGRWCEQHAARVQNSQDDLQARIKSHDKQADSVRKLRSHYFNKCRLVEDLEEEDKLAFKEPMISPPMSSPKADTPTVKVSEPDEDEDEEEVFEIADDVFQKDQMRKILSHVLDNVRLGETKVPILGTYQNTTTGAEIVEYIQKHMNGSTVSHAERVGQDFIKNGFLRLVGNVGSVFANSSRMNYQWRPKAFKLTGLPERRMPIGRSSTIMSTDSMSVDSPLVTNVTEYLAGLNPLNNPHPNETPAMRLRREAREADERYKLGVKKLDGLRCNLEEAIIEHLKFMERCELDRLKAIKSVILDFSGAISNTIPSLQSTVDKMMLFQETVQPQGDLRYLLENYRTGAFVPKVQPYENYYNSVDEQTFGVDVEARARSDKKRVPLIVTTILMHLDNNYPLLDGDEARRGIWTVDVPLATTHQLRAELNTGINPSPSAEILSKYDIPVVASCLKLYLLELPDSLVSSSLYDIIKTIYSSPQTSGSDEQSIATRVHTLPNTLGQLRLANIATLDAITTHFCRMIDLTSADEPYIQALTQALAPCVLRSRTESSITFGEKYTVRFLRDLLNNKDAIFNELKRHATLQHSASVLRAHSTAGPHGPAADNASRQRAISTDESNRRAHMEERNRAIASRSRAASPTRGSRDHGYGNGPSAGHDGHHRLSNPSGMIRPNHRRDSSRGPETRFPVATPSGALNSPRSAPRASRPGDRDSLEVPSGAAPTVLASDALASATSTPQKGTVNGAATAAAAASPSPAPPPVPSKEPVDSPGISANGVSSGNTNELADADVTAPRKSDSLGRRTGVVRKAPGMGSVGSRSSLQLKRDSAGSEPHGAAADAERRGVELVDKPMDD